MAVLSRLKQLELITHATWKALLNGWRRPAQQREVTELMSFGSPAVTSSVTELHLPLLIYRTCPPLERL